MRNEKITMVMSSLNADERLINLSLQSARHFDEIILFIDPDTKIKPVIDERFIVPPIRKIRSSRHLNVAQAYDYLVMEADDGWISTSFDDDYYDINELGRLCEFIRTNDIEEDIVHFRTHITGDLPYHQWGKDKITLSDLEQDNQLPASSFFRKKVWEGIGGFRGEIAHDWVFWLRAMYKGYKFRYFDGAVFWFNYRIARSPYHRDLKEKFRNDKEKVRLNVLRHAREDVYAGQ